MTQTEHKPLPEGYQEQFMLEAIRQAHLAEELGEVPIGAVVVRNGQVVGTGYNTRETGKLATAHAEIAAIEDACRRLGGWRLHQCDLYVTLEPCPMCSGAIINARIQTVYFGAYDPKAGCAGSVTDLFALPFNHRPQLFGGMLEDQCAGLLSDFFSRLREERKKMRDIRTFCEN